MSRIVRLREPSQPVLPLGYGPVPWDTLPSPVRERVLALWTHLLTEYLLTATLLIDGEGVYDPRDFNDRLLLGLKGTMSEWELGVMRQRSLEALRAKATRGELYDGADRLPAHA